MDLNEDSLPEVEVPDAPEIGDIEEDIPEVEVPDSDNTEEYFPDQEILEVEEVSFLDDLHEFFKSHLIDTPDGFLQIFQSFTYGEMVISFLLLVLVLLFGFKWLWEVLR